MNGKVARRIRKEIYGDLSLREVRAYSPIAKLKDIFIKDKNGLRKKVTVPRNTALSTGPRRKYRLAKKGYKAGLSRGEKK